MLQVRKILGKHDDVSVLKQELNIAQKAIHEKWFNPEDFTYANGEQPYLIFPLQTGITPGEHKKAVFEKYVHTMLVKDKGHLNTGMGYQGRRMGMDDRIYIGADFVNGFVEREFGRWFIVPMYRTIRFYADNIFPLKASLIDGTGSDPDISFPIPYGNIPTGSGGQSGIINAKDDFGYLVPGML